MPIEFGIYGVLKSTLQALNYLKINYFVIFEKRVFRLCLFGK